MAIVSTHKWNSSYDHGQDFIDWYSKKNAVSVIGWLGGNVLQHFAITIDYPNKVSYWEPQRALDLRDLDYQAGADF
jgi:hypothetical protein